MPKIGPRTTFILSIIFMLAGNSLALVMALKVLDQFWLAIAVFIATNVQGGITLALNGFKLPAAAPPKAQTAPTF